MVQHCEGRFETSDFMALYYQAWIPSSTPQAIVGIVHGLGSHSGMFSTVIDHLTPHGYGIYGLDLRGHGRSPGQRGYIQDWSDFRNDVQHFLHLIIAHHPNTPIVLWGHSLGGLIVLDFVLRCHAHASPLCGIVITAPALGSVGVSPLRILIGKMLSRLWPRFSLDTGLKTIPAAHDPIIAQAVLTDPLCHHKGTARLATEFCKTAQWVRSHASHLHLPILMLHGSDDLVTHPESSRLFFDDIPWVDKQRNEYEGSYHDLHIDTHHHDVLTDVQHWLAHHLLSIENSLESNRCSCERES